MASGEPKLKLDIIGRDGNAFAIIERAKQVMKEAGKSKEEIDAMQEKAFAGSYGDILRMMSEMFEITSVASDEDDEDDDDWDEDDDDDEEFDQEKWNREQALEKGYEGED
jgi:hypothetical protein